MTEKMTEDSFCVGVDRWWPDWFHDAISNNRIITVNMGKFGNGDVSCYVHTPETILIARHGDTVRIFSNGLMTVVKGVA